MRPLIDLSNQEKINYLHQLLPNDMPAFISSMETTAAYILKNKNELKSKWQSKTISFDEWVILAEQAAVAINKFRSQLIGNAAFFCSELFAEYMGIFSFHCLQEYINICPNQRLRDGVKFFFDIKPQK